MAWLAQFVDIAALGTLTLLAGVAAQQSWTADVLKNGFLLLPVMAATELRPRVCAAVVIPTVVVYLAAAIATQDANAEPSASITLGTCVLAGVGAGCIGLSAIQRSRVMTISSLARDRTHLLAELISLERRERQVLAEHLHDGALQYVLAARQDLDEIGGEAEERFHGCVKRSTNRRGCSVRRSRSCIRLCWTGSGCRRRSATWCAGPRRRDAVRSSST